MFHASKHDTLLAASNHAPRRQKPPITIPTNSITTTHSSQTKSRLTPTHPIKISPFQLISIIFLSLRNIKLLYGHSSRSNSNSQQISNKTYNLDPSNRPIARLLLPSAINSRFSQFRVSALLL
jgi:hypothetical protein